MSFVLASVGFGFVDWIKDVSVRPRHCVVPVAIEVKDVDSALDIVDRLYDPLEPLALGSVIIIRPKTVDAGSNVKITVNGGSVTRLTRSLGGARLTRSLGGARLTRSLGGALSGLGLGPLRWLGRVDTCR